MTCSTEQVAISGILEPAYAIRGDSFDYAFDQTRVDFAVVDAIGHGMSAVLMSAAAINSLRNPRRARRDLPTAYEIADESISTQFPDCYYVTGIIGTLDLKTGTPAMDQGWPRPADARAQRHVCRTTELYAVAADGLGRAGHRGGRAGTAERDRVRFYTDGITDPRSSDGSFFGDDRLADFLVRASLERLPARETVRHLADNILTLSDVGLHDHATMLLMEYHPPMS